MKRRILKHLAALAAATIAFACTAGATHAQTETYFDAHNHFTGILPYYAYADLPAFIARMSQSSTAVGYDDRLALYKYIAGVWYPQHRSELGNRLFSPADGQRYSLGARAALVVYRDEVVGSVIALDGALERILTATPWTEFDSAYAFRGGPAYDYLKERFYSGNDDELETDLCHATILDLAATNIDVSEQSLPFIGGWGFADGRSTKLNTILCAMNAGSDPHVAAGLRAMGKSMPVVTFVLMTHTSQLATLPGGSEYSEWSKTGACAPVPLPAALQTSPSTIYHALLGLDDNGNSVVDADRRQAFFQSVAGIDTAGPETTCFTPDGMAYYEQLVQAVYDAAKVRRSEGWHGKLLVHTHVGEGGTINYAPAPPVQPWSFGNAFSSLPATLTNSGQAATNISTLLTAIAAFERNHPDAANYVVFRLAHDTWANDAQAVAMHDEGVEADVSLESNVATGAYPISRMPLGQAAVMSVISPLLRTEGTNFELNDLLRMLVSNPNDDLSVGPILGNATLKFLLERRVRCLLGTDAAGVEHSDIVKEYEYAGSLIAYWNRSDPTFRSLAANVTQRTLFDDARWHLNDMSTDTAPAY
ncbi:MAG: hypothetical protein WCD38_10835 [Candidatus Tumulicola sp.]